ncbi:MAG TPA: SpoIIE family protein phosphatase [Vicinamibacterales bacterium]|nr:SpoIIE family protein phosphatase [Vicinamibacterales bacterium]
MTSNRPLLPGDAPSRADAWVRGASIRHVLHGQSARRWLLGSFAGRVLLVGLAIKIQAKVIKVLFPSTAATLDVVDALGSLAVIFVGAYLLTKGAVWAKRRLLWRVRRKLILSYVFVGLVPGLLIIAFFLMAGFLLFFNVSSYVLQSRVRTFIDQAQFTAESAALETEHGDPPDVLRRRLEQRQAIAAARFPFTSYAIVPVEGLECATASVETAPPARPIRLGPWRHLPAPERLPRWIRCDGFAGLFAYEVTSGAATEHRLVMRAVAVPDVRKPHWAMVVDMPFTAAIEQRLLEETGVELGEVTASPFDDSRLRIPRGQLLETRPRSNPDDTSLLGNWVAWLDVHEWETGADNVAAIGVRLNLPEVYQRITDISSAPLSQVLLLVLAFIGVLFLTIQFVALVIGFALARQITGAVHDLFEGTEHLRNRDFTYHIPVRARDQLGELAESFNVMTGEITTLIRENAEKARMEQEMLAAREIQQRLLPSGPMSVPGVGITAFCVPAREVAGDYFDFIAISPTRLGVLIADVSGKGLPAGLYMAQLKVIAQSLARTEPSPRQFLKAVNRVVADNIDSKSFITMSYGVMDLEKMEMAYARAGHCPLIRVPGAAPAGLRKAELIAPDGLVLGLKLDDGAMFDGMIEEVTVPLSPGDLIVFFTDGISETMNMTFDCYGETRLAKVLEQYAHLPFEQLRSFIFADLHAFAGEADQHDDMTMILMKVEEP